MTAVSPTVAERRLGRLERAAITDDLADEDARDRTSVV